MKIAFFKLEDWEKEYIEKHELFKSLHDKTVFFAEALDKDNIPKDTSAETLCIFIHSKVDKTVLDAFSNVKFIVTRSTGFDHIDLKECEKRNIQVANVPSYGEDTVAEYTFALLLALTRKIRQSADHVRETGRFSREGLRGFDLKGKTIAVIGTGKIGRNVIQIAEGFDMNILACDVHPDKIYEKETGFRYCDLSDAFAQSDIVTLHVPYNEHTHYLLNAKNISQLKKGAFIINTSRGGLIETAALVRALRDKQVAGAALDVLEEEAVIEDELELFLDGHTEEHNLKTVIANHVLMDMPNVIITPHNAFNTWEALQRILDTTMNNIKGFQEGDPQNLVTEKQ